MGVPFMRFSSFSDPGKRTACKEGLEVVVRYFERCGSFDQVNMQGRGLKGSIIVRRDNHEARLGSRLFPLNLAGCDTAARLVTRLNKKQVQFEDSLLLELLGEALSMVGGCPKPPMSTQYA